MYEFSSKFVFEQCNRMFSHNVPSLVSLNNIKLKEKVNNGILLPKLFWPIVRKNCSSDREKLLKFEDEGQEFAKFLRSLEQFIQTVKGLNNFF